MCTNKKDIKFWTQTLENLKRNNNPFAGELIINVEQTIENLRNCKEKEV